MTRTPSPRRKGLLYLFSAAQSLEVAEDDKEKDKNSTRLQQQQQQLEQDQQNMDQSPREPQYVRVRVANACDSCKIRKVKCDGKLPCSYCTRHKRAQTCHFTPQKRRRLNSVPSPASDQEHQPKRQQLQQHHSHHGENSNNTTTTAPPSSAHSSAPPDIAAASNSYHPASTSAQQQSHVVANITPAPTTVGSAASALRDSSVEEEAEVPRDARLLYDAQGKLIFIGDCAPLSFFQTVRQLVLCRIDPHAFAHHTGRVPVLQNVNPSHAVPSGRQEPYVDTDTVHSIVNKYLAVTSGLVDLFGSASLVDDISTWSDHKGHDVHAAVNYLVLAIGLQSVDDSLASSYFEHAKVLALATLGSELSVGTVQAFTLITIYMLRACQITGAFLFFGIAVRAVYSIGAHRTEVNSRFGHDIRRHRDRLWKSVRIIDLFLSISMGRPPATSDVDCTVPYRELDTDGHEIFDLLDSSVQVLLIIETIVLEVFSRKKISLQLTEGISRQLRKWSNRWLAELKRIVGTPPTQEDEAKIVGACHVLCSYYYAVMLVSRPFLMYEMCKRLPESPSKFEAAVRDSGSSGRSKLANASIDAGSLMIESVTDLLQIGVLDGCMPLIVSWLFAASLVVGVGLLGDFGRILDKDVRMSIAALEHFAKHDAHAMQYSLIIKSLHISATEYLERKERYERLQISESSSQLFGLTPRQPREPSKATHRPSQDNNFHSPAANHNTVTPSEGADTVRDLSSTFFEDLDPSIFPFIHSSSHTPELPVTNSMGQNQDQVFGALNLFPLLEEGGHIDLAHYM